MKGLRPLLILVALTLAFVAPEAARAVTTVVVDAGHGGIDRGGVPGQRASEKIYTLSVAQRLASKLRENGYRVVMTRSSDDFVGLGQRCAIANAQSNAVFLSVHFNSAPRLSATGVETYYYTGKSASLAAAVHREVVRLMGTPDRGIRQRGFYVIRRTNCPSVLVEPGFLSNAGEAARLASPVFQDSLASALARAIASRYH